MGKVIKIPHCDWLPEGQDGAILVTAITFPQSPSGPGAQNFFFTKYYL